MKFPLVRDLAARGFPVRLTCGVLGFSTQGYYRWCKDPCSQRDWDDAHLVNVIVDVHRDDPPFGYRFIADELKEMGHELSETRVHKLCRQHKIWSTTTKKGRRASGKTPGPAVADDLVQRDFSAPAPDRVWLTDMKDVFSNRIVGYAIDARMTKELACAALRMAVARRSPRDTVIVHADRGSQFRSRSFRAVLKTNGLTLSMGRVASAGDNAAMESFHYLLQKNVLNQRRTWSTRAELRYEIVTWIERTYNRRRRQRRLGKLTPVEFELAFSRHTQVAA
jgi:putative transposase